MKFHVALLAIALACPALAQSPEAKKVFKAQNNAIERAHMALKRTLKDPDSAKFGGDVIRNGVVCGLVNAKNAFGGYNGEKAYLYLPDRETALILETEGLSNSESSQLISMFERYCQS